MHHKHDGYMSVCDECDGQGEDEEPDDEGGGNCHWCGGEGWDECDDPLECTSTHSASGLCRCKSCGGSGDAKDMTIW